MENYEKMSISEVKWFAKQGDKDALYEMAYRYPDNEKSPGLVWAAFWFEKAAAKGHIYAKRRLAGFFQDMPTSRKFSQNRKKAMALYESIAKDYEAGKLIGDDQFVGMVSKIELGIMLCEGIGTERDYKKGLDLIKSGEEDMNASGGLSFTHLLKLGELFGGGYAQADEEPWSEDYKKAIEYLEKSLTPEKSNEINREKVDYVHRLKDSYRKGLLHKEKMEKDIEDSRKTVKTNVPPGLEQLSEEMNRLHEQILQATSNKYAEERRAENEKPTEIGNKVEDSICELWGRMAKEGW